MFNKFLGKRLDDSVVAVVWVACKPCIGKVQHNSTWKVPNGIYFESLWHDIEVAVPLGKGSPVLTQDGLYFLGYCFALFYCFGYGTEPKFLPCEFSLISRSVFSVTSVSSHACV